MWGLFVLELLFLWFCYSMTLMVPGGYDLPRLFMILIFASVALFFAYIGSKKFAANRGQTDKWSVILAPPLVAWIVVSGVIVLSAIRMVIVYFSEGAARH